MENDPDDDKLVCIPKIQSTGELQMFNIRTDVITLLLNNIKLNFMGMLSKEVNEHIECVFYKKEDSKVFNLSNYYDNSKTTSYMYGKVVKYRVKKQVFHLHIKNCYFMHNNEKYHFNDLSLKSKLKSCKQEKLNILECNKVCPLDTVVFLQN